MRKLIISIILILILSSVAFGAFSDDQVAYWDFTSSFDDLVGSYDWTNNGVSITGSGGDWEQDDSDYLTQNTGTIITDGAFTIAMTFKMESYPSIMILYDEHNGITTKGVIVRLRDSGGGVIKPEAWHDGVATYFDDEVSIGTEYSIIWTHDGTNSNYFYVDDNSGSGSVTTAITESAGTITTLGRYTHATSNYYDGLVKETCLWDRVLTSAEITEFMTYGCEGSPPVSSPFQINATELINGATITTFNATINGTNYATTNGTINTALLQNNTGLYNIRVYANDFIDKWYTSQAVSSNLEAELTRIELYSLTYAGFNTTNGFNYVRNLTYSYNYTCESGSTTFLDRYINATLNNSVALTCDNTTQTGAGFYQSNTEGAISIYFKFNTTGNNTQTGTNSFIFDLYAPTVISLTFIPSLDFVTPSANVSLQCNDSIYPNLIYNMSLNSGLVFYGNNTPLYTQTNTTNSLINGANVLIGVCSDPFSSDSDSITQNLELRTLFIIDEQKNTAFNVQNLSSVIVYLDNNRSSYDFKTNAKSNITFVATADVKLRFELIYTDGTIILRYVDIGLLEDDVRVCANTDGVTHYEQILTSSVERPVILTSVYANCLVAADYTRFAYQNTKVLKAYTYNNLYYLYTFEDNDVTQDQLFLASVDGSIATFINLDSLEFIEEGYNINTIGDTLAVKKRNINEMELYYYDVLQNNDALRIIIERLDTNEILLNTTTFTDPNEAQIILNIATLTPAVNDTSLFRINAISTGSDGEESTTIKYFNTQGVTGSLNSGMIAIVSLLVLIFGLSFTVAQRTFAYFGIFILIANIAFLSLATAAWFITFLMAVNAITLIFITLVLVGKNSIQIG